MRPWNPCPRPGGPGPARLGGWGAGSALPQALGSRLDHRPRCASSRPTAGSGFVDDGSKPQAMSASSMCAAAAPRRSMGGRLQRVSRWRRRGGAAAAARQRLAARGRRSDRRAPGSRARRGAPAAGGYGQGMQLQPGEVLGAAEHAVVRGRRLAGGSTFIHQPRSWLRRPSGRSMRRASGARPPRRPNRSSPTRPAANRRPSRRSARWCRPSTRQPLVSRSSRWASPGGAADRSAARPADPRDWGRPWGRGAPRARPACR